MTVTYWAPAHAFGVLRRFEASQHPFEAGAIITSIL